MSQRQEMHAWFASRQQAAAGDDAAAQRYEELAVAAQSREMQIHWSQCAAAARLSAEENRSEMASRMAGTWRMPSHLKKLKAAEART